MPMKYDHNHYRLSPMQPRKLPPVPHARFGDWNACNVALREETDRRGGNEYRAKYLEAIKKRDMKKIKKILTELWYLLQLSLVIAVVAGIIALLFWLDRVRFIY